MSTKVGIITEGAIDSTLLPALLSRVAIDKASFRWPLDTDDIASTFFIRKRGQGRVLETVRKLVRVLEETHLDYSLFVILLDRRTGAIQRQVRKLIAGRDRFVLGVAIEEIEAWWLGDRTNTLDWSGFSQGLPPTLRYADRKYNAERDKTPKKTLDELTRESDRFDRVYADGNLDMAIEFAEDYWRRGAKLDEIASQCPRGFRRFQDHLVNSFNAVKTRESRLL